VATSNHGEQLPAGGSDPLLTVRSATKRGMV